MYLEEGKKYSKILTDIMVGRGINGVEMIKLGGGQVIEVKN